MGLLALGVAVFGHFLGHRIAAALLGVKTRLVFPACCGPLDGHGSAPGKRLLLIAAGPLTSYLLAVVPLTAMQLRAIELPTLTVEKVVPGLPAEKAGIRPGDEIFGIDGDRARDFEQLRDAVAAKPEKLHLDLHRPGEIVQVDLEPQPGPDGNPVVGIVPVKELTRVPFGEAVATAHRLPLHTVLELLGPPRFETVGGPVVLNAPAPRSALAPFNPVLVGFLIGLALWSLVLGAGALLPLPGLDGALLLLTLRELLGGKAPDEAWHQKARRWLLWSGVAIAVGLTALALQLDVARLMR